MKKQIFILILISLPIQYALAHPLWIDSDFGRLDFSRCGSEEKGGGKNNN